MSDPRPASRPVANPRRTTGIRVQLPDGTDVPLAEYDGFVTVDPEQGVVPLDADRIGANRLPDTAWRDVDGAELVHPARRRRTREEWALLWAKSVCWRAISTGTLFFIAWLVTGSWSTGGVVAVIHMVITIVIYVPHDLAWERYSARRTSRGQTGAPSGT